MRPVIRESVVWTKEKRVRRTRSNGLTAEEQASVRRVLWVLRQRAGTMVELAKTLGLPYQSVRHLFVARRPISMATAHLVAKAAKMPLKKVLGVRWAKSAACPLCGRRG